MEDLRKLGIKLWVRYVDDIFATMDNKEQAERILSFLNAQHPNLRFTIEHEANNKLPFLDTSVERKVNKFSTTMYRKKTFTGVYLNWTSLTSKKYKIGLIRCLADRVWKICSESEEREVELNKLKVILARNDYPPDVVEKALTKFRESKEKPADTKPEKPEKRFLKLPYVNRTCDEFAHRLKNLVESNFPQVEFNVAFQSPMNIGKMFPFKDRIKNTTDRSMVVYSITCTNCQKEYIGETQRILSRRVKEHSSNGESNKSSCKRHERETGHVMDYEGVEVIDSADTATKLEVKELLHILKKKPALNKQLNSQSDFDIKTLTIAAHPHFRTAEKQ
jgi:hypothetical protein